jgi:flagellar export protein FliJ
MAVPFALLGLLRLRHSQEEQAGATLARAHGRVRDNAAIDSRARRNLAAFGSESTSTEALRAIAANRSSSASMLTELNSLSQQLAADVDVAQTAYKDARTKSVGLEKLEERHNTREAEEDLRIEQNAIDEIANASFFRQKVQG